MQFQPKMTVAELNEFVKEVFPESIQYLWHAEEILPGGIRVSMKITEKDLRPGGTISGPTMFSLADVTAYLLILAHIGKVALAVTTNLNINFLNKPVHGDLIAEGTLLKLGKRLAVCDVRISSVVDHQLVAHATATYSIPPAK
ncbi:MAG: PaaI family thioesterase [Rhizobiaceae bacterium]|nr:PaaI family thioesterase [Rhizobiaceae bacterium]